MSGVLNHLMALPGLLLRSSITVGSDGGTRRGYSAAGVATAPGFGAMSPVTFTDNGGTTRTVGALYWRSGSNEVVFAFPSGSPPDTDYTFIRLRIGSTIFTRAARSFYGAWAGPGVAWSWVGVGDPFVVSPIAVQVE